MYNCIDCEKNENISNNLKNKFHDLHFIKNTYIKDSSHVSEKKCFNINNFDISSNLVDNEYQFPSNILCENRSLSKEYTNNLDKNFYVSKYKNSQYNKNTRLESKSCDLSVRPERIVHCKVHNLDSKSDQNNFFDTNIYVKDCGNFNIRSKSQIDNSSLNYTKKNNKIDHNDENNLNISKKNFGDNLKNLDCFNDFSIQIPINDDNFGVVSDDKYNNQVNLQKKYNPNIKEIKNLHQENHKKGKHTKNSVCISEYEESSTDMKIHTLLGKKQLFCKKTDKISMNINNSVNLLNVDAQTESKCKQKIVNKKITNSSPIYKDFVKKTTKIKEKNNLQSLIRSKSEIIHDYTSFTKNYDMSMIYAKNKKKVQNKNLKTNEENNIKIKNIKELNSEEIKTIKNSPQTAHSSKKIFYESLRKLKNTFSDSSNVSVPINMQNYGAKDFNSHLKYTLKQMKSKKYNKLY
ncbi:hypothetical protein EDEG_03863 [Edhazardia aedis USNM 41457]|uniref:Uncharacterized protein n=1 Tax=Edhazardia aedis (strain USNM 41457) TaxID=1003232 RepID=J8ZPH8_EDHAE|nr:hypothetical protein EDEG_03863 [Edhazardia aedis USNM 41457]|eukprot:EJW01578.1 hypothetical protein EDEG_03863 [Edhazardia aedis USNM 41457]